MNAPLDDTIGMKHGAGGRAMRGLIEQVFAPGLPPMKVEGVGLSAMDDGAALRIGDRYLVITTDSHVIQPVFFPGGDIGRLAVAGTVNDLAMMGATDAPLKNPHVTMSFASGLVHEPTSSLAPVSVTVPPSQPAVPVPDGSVSVISLSASADLPPPLDSLKSTR